MRTIGMVGGMGPESTKDYYARMIKRFNEASKDFNYPRIIIYCVNMKDIQVLQAANDWDGIAILLADAVSRLAGAGADFAFISANTPHIMFDKIKARSPLPLVPIVDVVVAKAKALGIKRPLLLGTRFTMASDMYPHACKAHGIEIMVPAQQDQGQIHRLLFTELELGIFKPQTRQWFKDLISMHRSEGADSVILGCTELPLLMSQADADIPVLDTTQIHVDAICELAIG